MSGFRLVRVLLITMMMALVLFATDRSQTSSFSLSRNGTSLVNTLFVKTVGAWAGCPSEYVFLVDGKGDIYLTSTVAESPQEADVFIDGDLVATVSAPGPSGDGEPIKIGHVSLTDGHHTYKVVGKADAACTNEGELDHHGHHTDEPPAGGGQCIAYEAHLPPGPYGASWIETPNNRPINGWLIVDDKDQLLINYLTGEFHTGDLVIMDSQGNEVGRVHVDQPSNSCTWSNRTSTTSLTPTPADAASTLTFRHSVNPGGLWDPVLDTTGYDYSEFTLLSAGRMFGPGSVHNGTTLGANCLLIEGEVGDIVFQVRGQIVTIPVSPTFTLTRLSNWPCLIDTVNQKFFAVAGMVPGEALMAVGVLQPDLDAALAAFSRENGTDGIQDGQQYSYRDALLARAP